MVVWWQSFDHMAGRPWQERSPTTVEESSSQKEKSCLKPESKHQIFLSHSGAQKPFVEQLCKDLEAHGYRVFFDQRYDSLAKGEEFAPLIFDAARSCQVAVVVLSEEYLNSTWPMLELAEFVRARKSENKNLKLYPLFYKASTVDLSKELIEIKWKRRWMELVGTDPRVDLEKWAGAVKAVRGVNGPRFDKYGNSEVSYRDAIVKDIFTLSPPDLPYDTSKMLGCDRICKILESRFQPDIRTSAQVLGLYGFGGLGKTTMSKSLCNYFNREFLGRVCYIDIKEGVPALERQRTLMRKLLRLDRLLLQSVDDVSQGWKLFQSRMKDYPVFLVIDNVQPDGVSERETREYLDVKYNSGSKIMVVSRSPIVLKDLLGNSDYCYELPPLTREEAAGILLQEGAPQLDYSSLPCDKKAAVEGCLGEAWFSRGAEPVYQDGVGHLHHLALRALGVYLREKSHPSNVSSWNTHLPEYGKLKDTRDPYKKIFETLGLQFNTLDGMTKLMYLDICLYASKALESPMLSNSPFEELIAWLANIHRVLPELSKSKILDFQRFAMITIEGVKVIVHDLYKDYAAWFLEQLDLEEVTGIWCVGKKKNDGNSLPSPLQDTPAGRCWPRLKRILLEDISCGGFPIGKVLEWCNVVVLQIVGCSKLTTINLGGLSCLRHLELKGLFGLKTLTFTGYETSSTDSILQGICRVPGQCLPPPLQFVTIDKLSSLECLPSFSPLTALKFLRVVYCDKLTQPPSVQNCSRLERMLLSWHPNQKSLPNLHGLTSLRDLTIWGRCIEPHLGGTLKLVGLSSLISLGALELWYIPVGDLSGLENLTRIEYICLRGMHYLTRLPPLNSPLTSSLHLLDITCGLSKNRLEGLDELKLSIKCKLERLASQGEIVPHTPCKIRASDRGLLGRYESLNICLDMLEKMSSDTNLLGLGGKGGIGKTALAKEIYKHLVDQKRFESWTFLELYDCRPPGLDDLQKQLLWDLLGVPNSDQQSYEYWFGKLSNQGPVLIVLDDICGEWEFHKLILNTDFLAVGSCIIAISRSQNVLKVIAGDLKFYLHEITALGYEDSEELFNLCAFGGEVAPKNLKILAPDIIKACTGLPLVLKVVGSALSCSTDEVRWLAAIDALTIGDSHADLMGALKWSYDCLSKWEKLMFVDIACIFYGWEIKDALKVWGSCNLCSCSISKTLCSSIECLIRQALVTSNCDYEGHNVLNMHGLFKDLGQIVGKSNGSHLEGTYLEVEEYKNQGFFSSEVRALKIEFVNIQFLVENFAEMPNLHFLILDGCNVDNNVGVISRELRLLQWRYMPLTELPLLQDLCNLVWLDFSQSTELDNISESALQACPNLVSLNLNGCTSITTLPDSIGRLSKLQVLYLQACGNLRKLPSSIGQLTALQELHASNCRRLEALPDTITALPGLGRLDIAGCSSMSKLPTTIGLLTGLRDLSIDLATEWQEVGIGQLNRLDRLTVTECTDEIITMIDDLGTLGNLDRLSYFFFCGCTFVTKLPETVGRLKNLHYLQLHNCEKVQMLPNSIGQLRGLKGLYLRNCSSLVALPESLGSLTSLEYLVILNCTSITKLLVSVGYLSSLQRLCIQGCGRLQSLPDSLRQLNALECLEILDCGSLEGLGASRVLQGLRIWGCTSIITELPGSCLMALDSTFRDPGWLYYWDENYPVRDSVSRSDFREFRLLETTDCGVLRLVKDTQSGRVILQRVHKLPCCKMTVEISMTVLGKRRTEISFSHESDVEDTEASRLEGSKSRRVL